MWEWKVLIEQLLLVTLSRQKRLQFLFLRFGFRFCFRFRLRIPAFPYAQVRLSRKILGKSELICHKLVNVLPMLYPPDSHLSWRKSWKAQADKLSQNPPGPFFIFFVFHRRKKEETRIQKIHRCNVVKKPKKETIRLIDIELSQIIKVFTWHYIDKIIGG